MPKRKAISNKLRFEVFKRDSFKCQYCGKSAPDVVLHVDHIKPVSEGGDNDITNLITSCFECNNGKSNILLDDNSIMEKQRKQLEELNERRHQLEMMMQWREGLSQIDDDKVTIITDKWFEITDYTVTEKGEQSIRKWIKKYEYGMVLDSVEDARKYLVEGKDGSYTKESVEKAFHYVSRICATKKKQEDDPLLKDLYYIRGIMKNRFHYVNQHKAIELLRLACDYDASIDSLKDFVLGCKNWTEFVAGINDFVDRQSKKDEEEL